MKVTRTILSALAAGLFALAAGSAVASGPSAEPQGGVRPPKPSPIICITCSDGSVVCAHDPVCLDS